MPRCRMVCLLDSSRNDVVMTDLDLIDVLLLISGCAVGPLILAAAYYVGKEINKDD